MTDDKPWLSLPDEDPPERGLAELMAAARSKAEIMAHPPWWKRALEMLRRPPVLALATIIVLLGGVIVVGRHPGEVQSASPPPVVQPETVPASAGSATTQVEEPPPAPPMQPPVEAPRHRAETPKKLKAPPPVQEKQAEDRAIAVGGDTKLELAEPGAADDAESVQKAPVPHVEPLAVQLSRCRSAAVHKDCAGARACAKQLEQRDRGYYDANVVNDATIKPCL